ncbi:hypothetical protein P421_13745 [Heyndrickxia coagulans P38]|uniref:hypothetical protein n=1 Tax=Heyndrickxia coagulans TaxID=1398 RepID=UPI00054F0998|nr:hypothetical protein [Heyndrickxia coagulans]KGT37736.1 hypothetical protein P421_13745 [Heyndrickxia coagulans P38]
MSLNSWNKLDIIIFTIQVVLLFYFYAKYSRLYGKLFTGGMCLAGWLFITPIGLIPVSIFGNINEFSVFRNIFWHYKIMKISINDIIIMLFLIITIIRLLSISSKKISSSFVKSFLLLFSVFLIGMMSTIFAPAGIDYQNIFIVIRYFILVFIAYFINLFNKNNGNNWIKDYMGLMLILSILSLISMSLLSVDYRPQRYWTHSFLQSQESQTVFLTVLCYGLFGLNGLKRGLLVFIGLIPAMTGYKFSIFVSSFILLLYFLSNFNQKKYFYLICKLLIKLCPIVFLIIPFLAIKYYVINISNMGSFSTRYYQVINMMVTLKNNGILSSLFGIGWNQWYKIYYSFPFLDLGAWTDEQIYNMDWKYSIQIFPFSLIRSVGFIGTALWVFCTLKIVRESVKNFQQTNNMAFLLLFSIIFIQTYFSFPDVLPESIFNITLIMGSLSLENKK